MKEKNSWKDLLPHVPTMLQFGKELPMHEPLPIVHLGQMEI